MNIEILDVTNEDVQDILHLTVEETQTSFVETTEQCLKEAKECANYKPVGLYANKTLVGFAMYGSFPQENGRVWLDRFLIDTKHQGRGFGKLMLDAMIKKLTKEFSCKQIYLSIVENNQAALHLYEKFGFQLTGESDINNEKIMVKKIDKN
ncbi:GNAT family N-acetyltransferase [Lederbergia lenta]|uniref:Spermine/spermidine acetyltransferase n=1 Tax=Lederbergia lenta TaxID=1467 RepID=A0A2X4W457_LEDLE|nr:GNAT family N-acetyltransferase [Lederbergia lenta]MCM3109663.1 GNAT family N-acetyltransferase [Lederbergia lenta]MEC2324586.1 GNAT family N-acetyltransferase [Lederbergia lenta]SQI59397.1 spermine/spermidine acetyltransferase [Lederbergia lenta]